MGGCITAFFFFFFAFFFPLPRAIFIIILLLGFYSTYTIQATNESHAIMFMIYFMDIKVMICNNPQI